MPRMDGFKLLAAIKADERMKYLPVILLSARAGDEAAVEGLQAGAGTLLFCSSHLITLTVWLTLLFYFIVDVLDDYLIKPFGAKELLARVATHLELGRFRRELEYLVQERTAKVGKESGEREWED